MTLNAINTIVIKGLIIIIATAKTATKIIGAKTLLNLDEYIFDAMSVSYTSFDRISPL